MANEPNARASVYQRSAGSQPDAGGEGTLHLQRQRGLQGGLGGIAETVRRAYEQAGLTKEEIEMMGPNCAGARAIPIHARGPG